MKNNFWNECVFTHKGLVIVGMLYWFIGVIFYFIFDFKDTTLFAVGFTFFLIVCLNYLGEQISKIN